MEFIPKLLRDIGLQSEKWISVLTALATIAIGVLVAWLVYIIVSKWVYRLSKKISEKTPTRWDNLLFDEKFFSRLGWMLAPVTLQIFMYPIAGPEAVESGSLIRFIYKAIGVWNTFAAVLVLSSLLDGVNRIYESYPISRDRPIKMFIQVVVIILYIIAVLITVNIFTGMDMKAVLGGLTVLASVIMLIFKDSILGFVAGIQLTSNSMLRIGDWIEMPSSRADGDVLEIGLVSVKVQNWDKTITTIPTYKLVSEAFTNWRGMEESGGRRIKRSVNIDVNSIRYLSDEDMEKLKESLFLKEYIEKKQAELRNYNEKRSSKVDERHLTNVGTFREYMEAWLSKNPDINQQMTHMVRQLQPGPTGLPLEIYCFSARQAWVVYERVQADIFDHFYAVMELFGLRAFQYPGTQVSSGLSGQPARQMFLPPEEL